MPRFPAQFALLAALTLAALAARAESEVTAIRLGPIRFGMSLDEIQAAVPGAGWQTVARSEFTGRAFKIAAADAIDFGGRRMKVEARQHRYDWDVILSARSAEAGPQACEQAGLAMLAALEDGAGALAGATNEGGESVPFGQASTARFSALDENSRPVPRRKLARAKVDRLSLSAQRLAERLEVKAYAAYDDRNADNCVLSVTVLGWREKPPLAQVPFDEAKVVRRLSTGERHRLASRLQLPPDGLVVPLRCEVSRQSGAVLVCHGVEAAATAVDVASVAKRFAGGMAFGMTALDRDDPQPVVIEIPVRIAASDVRPLTFTGPMLPMSEVAFDAAPSAREREIAFPMKALRRGV
ncbi:MAG: hypothetical protein IT483_03340, partial [Gammaproteobacteria bacterium]|nr:hypothetical protein [Gammaproteobacteria bacterium]